MKLLDVFLIGVALSMDACALTVANCAAYKKTLTAKKEWAMPLLFALFQGIMPIIGYYLGSLFMGKLENFSGYISAGIFFILALKIAVDLIKENRDRKRGIEKENKANLTFGVLLIQAVATSIDALVVGVTLNSISFSAFAAAAIIAAVTFALVSLALVFGKKLGKLFGKYSQWAGAVILLVLAVKSLVESFI